MKSTLRWSRKAILEMGDIFAFDAAGGTGDGGQDGNTGGTGGANTDSNDDDNEQQDGSADTGSGSDDDGDDPEKLKRKLQSRREQAARQDAEIKRLKAIEAKADELQKEKDEADRKGRTELENAKADLEQRDKVIAAKDDTIRRLTVENAFMTLKELKWHNPATALRLVDLSDVEFDPETGKVKDMKQLIRAAKDLAKENPYLVLSATDVDDKETPNGKPSGKPPAGKKGASAKTEDELRAKYNIHR